MSQCEKRVPYVLGMKNPHRSRENCIISCIDVLCCYIISGKRAGMETSVSILATLQGSLGVGAEYLVAGKVLNQEIKDSEGREQIDCIIN